jgi:hypothetical protein
MSLCSTLNWPPTPAFPNDLVAKHVHSRVTRSLLQPTLQPPPAFRASSSLADHAMLCLVHSRGVRLEQSGGWSPWGSLAALHVPATTNDTTTKQNLSFDISLIPLGGQEASPNYPAQRRRADLSARGRASACVRSWLGRPRPSTLCQSPLAAAQSWATRRMEDSYDSRWLPDHGAFRP